MKTSMHTDRPRYLNLLQIRLPVTGVVSITHRISGIILILCIPFCAYLLEMSLHNESGFITTQQMIASLPVRIFLGLGIFALAHHFFAGIRYLLFDIDIGVEKATAKRAAWFVVILDLVALAIIAGWAL